MTCPVVAALVSAVATAAGVELRCADRYAAAAPATCGDAIDVPLIVFVATSLVFQDDVIDDPGALISTQVP